MAEVTTNLPHCEWIEIYSAGIAPEGAKTLDVTIPAGVPPGGGTVEVSTTAGPAGAFVAYNASTAGTKQIGVKANQSLYMHFTSTASPPAGTFNGVKTYVH